MHNYQYQFFKMWSKQFSEEPILKIWIMLHCQDHVFRIC